MSIWWMCPDMARRFDPLFPEMGGLEHLADVRRKFLDRLGKREGTGNNTFFHPEEVEHVRKALRLLGDDEEAKATLMSKLAFAQMKNDCAG